MRRAVLGAGTRSPQQGGVRMQRRSGRAMGLGMFLVALFVVPATGQADHHHSTADPVASVGWLAGCWEGTLENGATYEEVWLPPRAGTLVGLARMTRDDRTLSFEFIRILHDHGALVYSAQPSGRPPTHFRATALDSRQVTFENPDHDFPHRIIYRFTPPDELFARIEGDLDGELRTMDFPLRRTACPGGV
jgi:hypothetical protein